MSAANTETARPDSTSRRAFHLVLVHGIGDREPGAVLRQAIEGIRRTFGKSGEPFPGKAEPAYQSNTPAGTITVVSGIVKAGDATIGLSEFHWGSVTGSIRLSKPLEAARNFSGILSVLPTLALSPTSPAAAKQVARMIGWLEWAACILMLVAAVAFLIEIPLRPAILANFSGQSTPPDNDLIPWSIWIILGGVMVVYLALILILPYLFLRYMAGVLDAESRASYSRLIMAVIAATILNLFFSLLTGVFLLTGVGLFFMGFVAPPSDFKMMIGSIGGFPFMILILWQILGVAGLVRDVTIYLGRAASGEALEVQYQIQDELLALIRKIQNASPEAGIVLVCHSLGTVIATDLLCREATRTGGARLTVDLVTAGSPLRRMVHRFLPQRALEPLQLRALLRGDTPVVVKRWFNCFRILDFVGQSLSQSFYCVTRLLARGKAANDPIGGISENLLNPLQGWRFGHGNYWADQRFVRFTAFTVLGLEKING